VHGKSVRLGHMNSFILEKTHTASIHRDVTRQMTKEGKSPTNHNQMITLGASEVIIQNVFLSVY
jgi:high-affinity nickel permease